jgi:hypothetical protein
MENRMTEMEYIEYLVALKQNLPMDYKSPQIVGHYKEN